MTEIFHFLMRLYEGSGTIVVFLLEMNHARGREILPQGGILSVREN